MSPPTFDNFDQAKHLIGELFDTNQQLRSANVILESTNEQLKSTNEQLSETVTKLQSQVAWLTRQMFGRKSERWAQDHQPTLFGQSLEASNSDPPTQTVIDDRQAAPGTPGTPGTSRRRRGKREPIPDHLPRVERIHDLPEDQKAGPPALKRIGEEVSEQLAFEPGRVYVIRHVRYKYVRVEQTVEESPDVANVILADKAVEGLPKCLAAPSLLAYIMVSLPAGRQVSSPTTCRCIDRKGFSSAAELSSSARACADGCRTWRRCVCRYWC